MAKRKIRIGISGWRYAPWRGVFYPKGLRPADELEFAARTFATIEINGTFYSLQRPEAFAAWYEDTPDDFVFAIKGPRYITHMLRLTRADPPLANFFASGILLLKQGRRDMWRARHQRCRAMSMSISTMTPKCARRSMPNA